MSRLSGEKPCSKCGRVKKLSEFHKKSAARDGLNSSCKACVTAKCRDDYDRKYPHRDMRSQSYVTSEYGYIALHGKNGLGLFAVVDLEDFERLNIRKWFGLKMKSGDIYATSDGLLMHREVARAPNDKIVDHKDGYTLNNRRQNVRSCSHRNNMQNSKGRQGTSTFKGVSRHKRSNRWRARIFVDGKQQHLGTFDTEVEAAAVYDDAARRHYGEYARLNFN